jgi:uncharacterized protein (DUF362 family)
MESKVALATGRNIYQATFQAIELLGGIEKFVSPGAKVFIKPNCMLFTGPPTTTNPLVVGALIELCRKAGAKKITVGELSIVGVDPKTNFEYNGMKDYVERFSDERCEVRVFCPSDEEPIEKNFELMESKDAKAIKKMWFPKEIKDADVFINVPVAKTHTASDITLGIKNMHGTYHTSQRRLYHTTEDAMAHKFIDALLRKYPNLTVTDCWYAGEGEGPYFMTFKKMGLVVASSDIVANDAVVSYLMGFDPLRVKMIRIANERGFGEARIEKIEILGESLESYRMDLKHPSTLEEGSTPTARIIPGRGPTLDYIKAHPEEFPDPSILEGIREDGLPEVCRGCIMALKYVQTSCRWFFPQMEYLVLVGTSPPDPSDIRLPDGRYPPIVVWGKCTCETTRGYKFRERGTKKAGGYIELDECPPLKLTMAEAFLEVSWDKKRAKCKRLVRRYLRPSLVNLLELLQGNPSFVLGLTKPVLTIKAEEL